MITLTSLYITVAMVVLLYMTALFVLALHLRNNSIADIGWGAGFIIATWAGWLQSDHGVIPTLALMMVILWGGRLSLHILQRNAGKAEDWRYERWRREWGQWFVLRSYLQVFVLQGILLCIIVAPAVWLQTADMNQFSWLSVLGIVLWTTGYGFEITADYQLKTFLQAKRHKDQVCDDGLWKYSRHPNYFGEALLWWGLYVFAVSLGAPFWLIASPLTITLLVRFVSGVPLLEQKMLQNAAYKAYAKRTNVFIPLPPRSK